MQCGTGRPRRQGTRHRNLPGVKARSTLRDAALELLGRDGGERPRVFFAPGRANLLGAHLDYNGGSVLPVALSRGTCLALRLRRDGLLRLRSASFPGEEVEVALEELRPRRTRGWSAYFEGALCFAMEAWGRLPGLEAAIVADLPMSRGLSSSASIESVAVYAAASLLGAEASADEMIRIAHRAENEYVGVRCGILDQAAILLARPDSALLLDCLELTREYLPFDARRAAIAIVDSGVRRDLAASAFNQRVAECTRALALLQERLPGITCLREVRPESLERHGQALDPVLRRRVAHVVGEVQRTLEGAEALRRGDLAGFGTAMLGAHESLRDLYEVSIPELDLLVEAAREVEGCYGARLTGAGFGGCIAAVVHPEAAGEFSRRVPERYREATGRTTEVLWFQPSGGPEEWS